MSSWDECELRIVGRKDILQTLSDGFSWSMGDKTGDLEPEWRGDYLFVSFYTRSNVLPLVRAMSGEHPELYFELIVEYSEGGWYGVAFQAGATVNKFVSDILDDSEPVGSNGLLLASLEGDALECQCEQCVRKEDSRDELASNMPEFIQDMLAERMKCRAEDQGMAQLRVVEFVRKHSQGVETAEVAGTAVAAAEGKQVSGNGEEAK